MTSYRLTLLALSCLGAASATGLCGCGSGSSSNSSSQVRFFNGLLAGTGNVDFVQRNIVVEGGQALGSLLPNSVNTSTNNINGSPYYTAVASGGNGTLNANGVTTNVYYTGNDLGTAIASGTFVLTPHDANTTDGTYTIVVSGVAGGTGASAPQVQRYIDNPSVPAGTPDAFIRVIDLAPDSTAGNALSLDNNGQPITTGGFTGITYTNTSNSTGNGYGAIAIVSGSPLSLSITNSANTPLINSIDQSGLPGGTIQAGHAYTIFVSGEINPTGGAQALAAQIDIDY